MFMAKRDVIVGYYGYSLANPPSLTESAKKFLTTYGPEKFKKRYGDHFVFGSQHGASVNMNVIYETSNENIDSTLKGKLDLIWSDVTNSNFSFFGKIAEVGSLSNQILNIEFKGTKKNINNGKIDVNEMTNLL